MMRSLFTSATAMDAQDKRISVIGNNLANVNTTGFKKSRVNFQDLMYSTIKHAGAKTSENTVNPTGTQIGHGVSVASTSRMHTQGDSIQTGRELDVAIHGAGFFQIELPNGQIAYTRAGNFEPNTDTGQLVLPGTGYPLLDSTGALKASTPYDGIVISESGKVQGYKKGPPYALDDLFDIQTANFDNPAGLTAIGNNLFVESGASGSPIIGTPNDDGHGKLAQTYLETS